MEVNLELNKTNLLQIESSQIYREVICSINSSILQDNDEWIFSDKNQLIKKSSSIDIIHSPFLLDFNNRKIQNYILEDLCNIAINEDNYVNTQKLLCYLEEYVLGLEWHLPYDIMVKNIDVKSLLKNMISGVVVSEDYMEQFCEYIKLIARMLEIKLIIMVDAMNCFDYKEWKLIEKTAIYEGIYILCIEHFSNYQDGNKIVIDCDGCRIV